MAPGTAVPVTPAVVQWAIDRSGFTPEALATAIGVPLETLRAWAAGKARPLLGEARRLADQLDRPLATFLLPAPPPATLPQVQFRTLPKSGRRALYPVELVELREAARLQRILSWVNRELRLPPVTLPHLTIATDPILAAAETRDRLGVTIDVQLSWSSPSASLHGWRTAVETSGVFVLMVSVGEDACRGFSLWDEYAPLVAANRAWNPEARHTFS